METLEPFKILIRMEYRPVTTKIPAKNLFILRYECRIAVIPPANIPAKQETKMDINKDSVHSSTVANTALPKANVPSIVMSGNFNNLYERAKDKTTGKNIIPC